MKYNKIIALAVFSVLSLCTTFIQKCSPGFDCVTTSVSDNVISQQVLKILYYIKLSDWTKATVIMNMSVFKQNIFSPLWNLFWKFKRQLNINLIGLPLLRLGLTNGYLASSHLLSISPNETLKGTEDDCSSLKCWMYCWLRNDSKLTGGIVHHMYSLSVLLIDSNCTVEKSKFWAKSVAFHLSWWVMGGSLAARSFGKLPNDSLRKTKKKKQEEACQLY